MSTTSLKLPDELKQRAVSAAHLQGVSTHAFMVNAIEQAAAMAECRGSIQLS
jgi:predicted transcriptional regulator